MLLYIPFEFLQPNPNNSKFNFVKHILHGGVTQSRNSKILMRKNMKPRNEEIKAKSFR